MLKSTLCLVASLTLASLSFAADKAPATAAVASNTTATWVLTADVALIYNGYWKVQEALKNLQEADTKANLELKSMYDEGVGIANEVQELQGKAANPALTDEARKKYEDEAKQKMSVVHEKEKAFNEYQQQIGRTLAKQQEELMKQFTDDLTNVTEDIRRDRGATIVLNAVAPIVISSDPKDDITQLVLDRLNATKPKTVTKTEGSTKASSVLPADTNSKK